MRPTQCIRVMIVLFLLFISSLVIAQQPVFRFTAIPDEDETRLTERFSKFAVYL